MSWKWEPSGPRVLVCVFAPALLVQLQLVSPQSHFLSGRRPRPACEVWAGANWGLSGFWMGADRHEWSELAGTAQRGLHCACAFARYAEQTHRHCGSAACAWGRVKFSRSVVLSGWRMTPIAWKEEVRNHLVGSVRVNLEDWKGWIEWSQTHERRARRPPREKKRLYQFETSAARSSLPTCKQCFNFLALSSGTKTHPKASSASSTQAEPFREGKEDEMRTQNLDSERVWR